MMETEKYLDKKLVKEIKAIGGWAIKLGTTHIAGLPDRLCLFPNGTFKFVEVKGTGLEPSPIQKVIHSRLHGLGFKVLVLDSTDKLNKLLEEAQNDSKTIL